MYLFKVAVHDHRVALCAAVMIAFAIFVSIFVQQKQYFSGNNTELELVHSSKFSDACYNAVSSSLLASPALAARCWEAHYPAGTFANTAVNVNIILQTVHATFGGSPMNSEPIRFKSATRAFWLAADKKFRTWITFASAGALPYREGEFELVVEYNTSVPGNQFQYHPCSNASALRGLAKAVSDLPRLARAGGIPAPPWFGVHFPDNQTHTDFSNLGSTLWARTPGGFMTVSRDRVYGWSRFAATASVLAAFATVGVVLLRSSHTVPANPSNSKIGFESNAVASFLYSHAYKWRGAQLIASVSIIMVYVYLPVCFQEDVTGLRTGLVVLLLAVAAALLIVLGNCMYKYEHAQGQSKAESRYFTIAVAATISLPVLLLSFTLQYAAIGLAIDPGNAMNPIVRSVLGLAYGYVALRTTARNGRVRLVGEHPWCQLILRARWMIFNTSEIHVQQWPVAWSRFWDRGRAWDTDPNKPEKSDTMWATHLYAPAYMHRVELQPPKWRAQCSNVCDPCLSDFDYYQLGLLGPSIYPLYLTDCMAVVLRFHQLPNRQCRNICVWHLGVGSLRVGHHISFLAYAIAALRACHNCR
jgi:hypothetical protein